VRPTGRKKEYLSKTSSNSTQIQEGSALTTRRQTSEARAENKRGGEGGEGAGRTIPHDEAAGW
jgi:hypothetical protein